MKFFILIRSLEQGGAERQAVTLANELAKGGDTVSLCTFYPAGILEEAVNKDKVNLVSLNKQGRWDIFGFKKRLRQMLTGLKPDVVMSSLPTANLAALEALKVTPRPKLIWGIRSAIVDHSQFDWLSGLSYRAQRKLSHKPDLTIVNSKAGRDVCIGEGFPENKLTVVPNGIDIDRFKYDPKGRQKWREAWGVGDDPVIGMVARIDPMKDYPTFLKAADFALQENPNLHFVSVGGGDSKEMDNMRDDLGLGTRMIWQGAESDLPGLYSAFDLATLTSYGESFPNVVAEAMACERLAVVTDVGDAAWIVDDKDLVVPPKSPERLAECWLKTLQKGPESLAIQGKTARQRIQDNFTVEGLARKTREHAKSLLTASIDGRA